jgi:hypothetical protein
MTSNDAPALDASLRRFPARVRHSTEHPELDYELLAGYFALHDPGPGAGVMAETTLNEGRIAILKGAPSDSPLAAAAEAVTPVYHLAPDGDVAVPTGLVLVRFAEHVRAGERAVQFAELGYRIARTLDYAPHALWLTAVDGDIAAALEGIQQLEALEDVVNVEPQMASPAVPR